MPRGQGAPLPRDHQETTMRSKAEMIVELRKLLNAMFVAQADGSSYVRIARERGYVDGYMRVLLDGGHATSKELLEVVARERAKVRGPATAEIAADLAMI
jgi:hypothetical protein